MVHLVRVRDPLGMHRLVFSSAAATWAELQQQVEDVTRVPIATQILSRKPLSQPQPVEAKATDTLEKLKLANGDVLYLGGHTAATLAAHTSSASGASSSSAGAGSTASASAASAAPAKVTLTPRCNHGPRGACPHCLGVEPGMENKVQGKCNHGPSATCIHCSATIKAQTKELPTWLCTHPDTVFCPKCLPPEDPNAPKTLACSCDHSKGQECSRCSIPPPTMKVDKIPFARYLDEKKGMCKFKHGPNVTCAMCVPPSLPSFVGKKDCTKGHQPWPAGVCLSCAPPNATIKEQVYRLRHSVHVSFCCRALRARLAEFGFDVSARCHSIRPLQR